MEINDWHKKLLTMKLYIDQGYSFSRAAAFVGLKKHRHKYYKQIDNDYNQLYLYYIRIRESRAKAVREKN